MTDIRLIEDYIPIEAISKEARREKSVRKGHISTLHLWWARRPLVAARAAVYGALVPAGKDKKSAKAASKFVEELCKYPGSQEKFHQAKKNILTAHAARLSHERGELVTVEDIEAGRAPRPKVLDMFAGGGAIPLEALRLGCEAYALDLNPIAHLIQLCTLVYPQQFGMPDATAKGCSPDGTWAGLAKEVEYWGKWVLEKVRDEIGDLYPTIPDPKAGKNNKEQQLNMNLAIKEKAGKTNTGMLFPVAYLWTRTVTCKNPSCGANVPLARQTWLAKKKGRFVALQPVAKTGEKEVKFYVVESTTEKGLGFDPTLGSEGGNVACPFCGTVADTMHVKTHGKAGNLGFQLMAVICKPRSHEQGKVYLALDEVSNTCCPSEMELDKRIEGVLENKNLELHEIITLPDEPLPPHGGLGFRVQPYGITQWYQMFFKRQLLSLLTFTKCIHLGYKEILKQGYSKDTSKVITTYLGVCLDRLADFSSVACVLNSTGGRGVVHTFGRQALPMTWDFAETNPFNEEGANWQGGIDAAISVIEASSEIKVAGLCSRGSATSLSFDTKAFDAVITDPPYYDNVPYSDLSDFFYVWAKRSIGFLYPEHFSSSLTPKKQEAIMDSIRHERDKSLASFWCKTGIE